MTYVVRRGYDRKQEFNQAGETDKIRYTLNIDYSIEIKDEGDGPFDPLTVLTSAQLAGLPIVNQDVWRNEAGTLVAPYLVCRRLQLQQTTNNTFWIANTQWIGETNDTRAQIAIAPPVSVTDIAPTEESRISYEEGVIYEDYSYIGPDPEPKTYQLPSGNMYADPLVSKEETLELVITQYETFIDYATMLARSFKFNRDDYRDQSPAKWMTGEVEATEVVVQLAGGPTPAALVKYPLYYNPFYLYTKKALIDKEFKDAVTGKFQAFRDDETRTQKLGLVTLDGEKHPGPDPKIDLYYQQESINFNNFLQI